jgi:hypothetical protein
MQALKNFLADYWLWILIPALLLGAGLAALLFFGKDNDWSPNDYDTVGRLACQVRGLLS